MMNKEVVVSISLDEANIRIGRLWFHLRKRRPSASFEYDVSWLTHPEKFALEPALNLTEGAFHTRDGLGLFGAIGDSAPDRWGRVLMRRAHRLAAEKDDAVLATMTEMDYLIGVNDEARQGALRFSLPSNETLFLASKEERAIPPLVFLPKLLRATEHFIADNETVEDLKLLLAPGSSLGGARPKASVRDQDDQLAIAKFPRKDDEYNVVAWEAVALTLAKKAGIIVPVFRLENIVKKPVLILQRFDRVKKQRVPFLSAMSMLDAKDNEQHSYLEMAYVLAQHGAAPNEDMQQLWRRIIFNILIANTDDRLRNHGFIYERQRGWRLSPAYDLNPTPLDIKPRILTTAINFDDTDASIETALLVAEEFRLTKKTANKIIKEVKTAVKDWRKVAAHFGIVKSECDYMASAFAFEKE